MNKYFFLAGSLSLAGLVAGISPASAEQVNSVDSLLNDAQANSVGQVTSVSQLSDVFPTDWAFQAVQSLVERYGCVAGYPDGTYRGQRSMTRYEAAALLNACLDNISDRFATKEDLETVRALQAEFQAELATLRGRVDGLEARTDTLEAQQFSTTTKLQGEVVIAGQFGDFTDNPTNAFNAPANIGAVGVSPGLAATALGNSRVSVLSRVRLNFNTSFSGSDLLQTQLEVGNGGNDFLSNVVGTNNNPFPVPGIIGQNTLAAGGAGGAGVPLVDLGASDFSGISSNVALRRLAYSFKPFGDDLTVTAGSNLFPSDFIDFNSYANNSAQDFSSGFFINNPLIITNAVDAGGGAGGAVDWNPNGGPLSFRATYVAADAGSSVDGAAGTCAGVAPGVAGGDICGGGLDGDPSQTSVEVEYANTFGSNDQNNLAIRLQYTRADTFNIEQNVVGANAEATLGRFGVFGRVGYSIDPKVDTSTGASGPGPRENLFAATTDNDVLSWMGGVGLKDLLIPGSLLAVAAGQPFIVLGAGSDPSYASQWNFEGFYRVAVNDNITLTPSIQLITNPLNLADGALGVGTVGTGNDGAIIQGLLRATFSF
ncbi:MAG: iron uptake porin [Cyanobacteria bacterium P01_F01_bin.42]